jgi:hypothetical protein
MKRPDIRRAGLLLMIVFALAGLGGCTSNPPTTILAVDGATNEPVSTFKLTRTHLVWRHPDVEWGAKTEPEELHSRDGAVVIPQSLPADTFIVTSGTHFQSMFQIDGNTAYIISDPKLTTRFEKEGFLKSDAEQSVIGPDRLVHVPVRPR